MHMNKPVSNGRSILISQFDSKYLVIYHDSGFKTYLRVQWLSMLAHGPEQQLKMEWFVACLNRALASSAVSDKKQLLNTGNDARNIRWGSQTASIWPCQSSGFPMPRAPLLIHTHKRFTTGWCPPCGKVDIHRHQSWFVVYVYLKFEWIMVLTTEY